MTIRTNLYIEHIQPAFSEMVNKIVCTYRFNVLPNIDEFKQDCKTWLVTILQKYDPTKGYKAFSYFSVVTKNWFICNSKKNSRTLSRETSYEELSNSSDDIIQQKNLVTYNPYLKRKEKEEFLEMFEHEMRSWEDVFDQESDIVVYNAVIDLMKNAQDLGIINKKAIYVYIREMTDLNTKQIGAAIKKMKSCYSDYKKNWDNGKIDPYDKEEIVRQ